MQAYQDLVQHVLNFGARKPNRTGVDTLSTFNYNYELWLTQGLEREVSYNGYGRYVLDGFPLLTTKAMSWKNIVVELLWFLSGSTNVAALRRHGCRFWDAWADADGEVPSAYGHFWRAFPVVRGVNDQLRWVVDELRRNPMSRRLVVTAWEPQNAQTSKLPPCHLLFAFNVQLDHEEQPYLCLHLTQRSCDVALGVPYNVASYVLLLHLVARMAGMRAGIFAHTLIDAHIYTAKADGSQAEYDHVPGLCEQLTRWPRSLPQLELRPQVPAPWDNVKAPLENSQFTLDYLVGLLDRPTEEIMDVIQLEGYDPHPAIPFKVAV